MFKNTAGQEWVVFAFEDEGGSNPGNPVAADQANITATVRIDGGSANTVDDANPTVLAGGYYTFGITAAESNGDSIVIIPVSGTSNVTVIGVPGAVYTRTDTSGIEAKIDLAQLDLDTITGTAGALIDDGTGAGQLALTGGAIDSVILVATTTVATDAEADIAALVATVGVAGAGLGDLGGMSTEMIAEVNAAVADVMKTDVIAERTNLAPPTTPTFEEAISYLYMMLTAKIDVDSGFKEFYNNAGTIIWKKALSDDASNYVEADGEAGT